MIRKIQQLILSVPLHSETAAFFAVILGTFGIVIPLVYISIAIQDSHNTLTYLTISRTDLLQVIDTFHCSPIISGVKLPPYWLSDSVWSDLFRVLPILVGMQYFASSKKSINVITVSVILLLILINYLIILFEPSQLDCDKQLKVTIYAYSISWFSIFIPLFSLLLGIYATLKRNIVSQISIIEA